MYAITGPGVGFSRSSPRSLRRCTLPFGVFQPSYKLHSRIFGFGDEKKKTFGGRMAEAVARYMMLSYGFAPRPRPSLSHTVPALWRTLRVCRHFGVVRFGGPTLVTRIRTGTTRSDTVSRQPAAQRCAAPRRTSLSWPTRPSKTCALPRALGATISRCE